MGSKNLKAIAVRGTKGPPYYNPARIGPLITDLFTRDETPTAKDRRWGHFSSIIERYYKTIEGVKNKQLGWDPICELHNPLVFEQEYKLWNDSCNIRHIGCKVPYYRMAPPLGPLCRRISS